MAPASGNGRTALLMIAGISVGLGGCLVRRSYMTAQLRESAERIQARVNWEGEEPLALTPEEMRLEACVKGPDDWELEHIRVFGADPVLQQGMVNEVLRPLLEPELLAAQTVSRDVHLEPPHLVLIQGPAQTGKKSLVLELARDSGITVLKLDRSSLESAQQAAWWQNLAGRGPGCVVQAAFSLARKLQPCIILLDKPHELSPSMQDAFRSQLQRLKPSRWQRERVSLVATTTSAEVWQPGHLLARHRMQTSLPREHQLAAMLRGFLHGLEMEGVRRAGGGGGGGGSHLLFGGGYNVQAELLAALANYTDAVAGAAGAAAAGGGDLGGELHAFLLSLRGRTAPQVMWLVLRARQRLAVVNGAGVVQMAQVLTLADLQTALQDLLVEERHLRARSGWWPGNWSKCTWLCVVAGIVVVCAMTDDSSKRSATQLPVAVAKR